MDGPPGVESMSDFGRRVSRLLLPLVLCGCIREPSSSTIPQNMALIPAGPFTMGSDKVDVDQQGAEFGSKKPWYLDEHPAHIVILPAYLIDRTEVTNGQYRIFVEATRSRRPGSWGDGAIRPEYENYPVTEVNWYEADHFCRWAGKRLSSEAEWEKASRGTDAREFPWGNDFDPKKANTAASDFGRLLPVGSFPEGASPYGVLDMAGNVMEWVDDWYLPYSGSKDVSPLYGRKNKVFRGGGFGSENGHYALPLFYRSAYRSSSPPEESYVDLGFRCAKSLP